MRLLDAVAAGYLPMPSMSTSPTYADLDRVLRKVGAKMMAWEVHAFYLGALTSTNVRLGPQQLFGRILGDDPSMGASTEDANENLQAVFGYWNWLVAEREQQGRVRFVPFLLPESAGKTELLAFVRRRRDELAWYVRGIDAGGDDPIEFGPDGQRLFERIGEASGFLEKYVEILGANASPTERECRESRKLLLGLVSTAERVIGDLMTVSDAVRREAIATFSANAGRETDDGARLARPARVGRNEKCPCGSGKKWKKCCGAASTLQ